jgi:hypothetical protein
MRAAQALPAWLHVQSWGESMTHKTLAGIACMAMVCAAGWASAQSTGGSTNGTSAMSSERGASSAKHTTSKRRSAAKASTRDSANGPTETPSGGLANPKDIAPGTYNSSGGAVPKTSDPMQTKSTRDGTPLPNAGAAAASGSGR